MLTYRLTLLRPTSASSSARLFIWGQIVGGLLRRSTNPNRNGGSSKASPINFFTFQSDESLTQNFTAPSFTARNAAPMRFTGSRQNRF
jgi:hypothetical protein